MAVQKKEMALKVLKTVLDLSKLDDPKVLISTSTIWLVVIILCYEYSHLYEVVTVFPQIVSSHE